MRQWAFPVHLGADWLQVHSSSAGPAHGAVRLDGARIEKGGENVGREVGKAGETRYLQGRGSRS